MHRPPGLLIAALVLIYGAACTGGARDGCAQGEEETSDSGLVSVDLECGDGAEASNGDALVVRYTGTLDDGTEFDSVSGNDSYEFLLESDKVIAGWNQGLNGMLVGGTRKLVIPPELAYGEEGLAGAIPPNATVTYVVELIDVRHE